MPNILEMKNISKSFSKTVALSDVSFSTKAGEVHVLIGENGAGKSTLMKILCGAITADSGDIYIKGKKVEIQSVQQSQMLGVGIIHQELNLLPNKTVFQNIFLGRELFLNKILGIVDEKRMAYEAEIILKELELNIDPYAKISSLSVSQQQMVEVAKALSMKADILIMDEPTSSLTRIEIETLFKIIQKLKAANKSIIYISHRMEEIFQIGDRVTVLRDGRYVMTQNIANINMNDLVMAMVGRKISDLYGSNIARERKIGEEALRINNLTGYRFRNCSLYVKRGEIVSLSGLVGSGRTELAKAIFGYDKIKSGTITVFGKTLKYHSPHNSIKNKMGFLPEDRKTEGVILSMSIQSNVIQAGINKIFKNGIINKKIEETKARIYTKMLNLNTLDLSRSVETLSGGNQQKVVVAKWLCTDSDLFIFDEPTRGIDIGAKADIYQIMNMLSAKGAAILIISSDQMEVVGISDRTYVMRDGEIAGELTKPNITPERILELAL